MATEESKELTIEQLQLMYLAGLEKAEILSKEVEEKTRLLEESQATISDLRNTNHNLFTKVTSGAQFIPVKDEEKQTYTAETVGDYFEKMIKENKI